MLVTAGAVLTAGAESFPGKVLIDVGLARPPAQDGTRESEMISRGQLGALDGDVILLSVAPGAARAAQRLQSSGAWRRLSRCAPAASAGWIPAPGGRVAASWRPGRR